MARPAPEEILARVEGLMNFIESAQPGSEDYIVLNAQFSLHTAVIGICDALRWAAGAPNNFDMAFDLKTQSPKEPKAKTRHKWPER